MRLSYVFIIGLFLFAAFFFNFFTLGFDGEVGNCEELEQSVENCVKHGKPPGRMRYDIIGYAVTMQSALQIAM